MNLQQTKDNRGPLTIGIRGTGPGTGKDAATEMFVELLRKRGLEYKQLKFATPIRQVIETLFGIPVEVTETTEGKNIVIDEMKVTTGQCLQTLGTALRGALYQGVIIDAVLKRLKPDERVIISDVRMKTEQIAVKQRGGIVILVDSNREVPAEVMAGRSTQHETERDLDGVVPDYVIKNDGTLNELFAKVEETVDRIIPATRLLKVSQQAATVPSALAARGFSHVSSPTFTGSEDPFKDVPEE